MSFCCDRYSYGVIIAIIYIVISIIILILNSMKYFKNHQGYDPDHEKSIKSNALINIIICLVTILISSLFIVAMVKHSEYLILPWLLLIVYTFYLTCKTLYWGFIGGCMGGATPCGFLLLILFTVAGIGAQIAIFSFSCSLFKELYNENNN